MNEPEVTLKEIESGIVMITMQDRIKKIHFQMN